MYDGVLILVKHNDFKKMKLNTIKGFCKKNHVIYDLKNIFMDYNNTLTL